MPPAYGGPPRQLVILLHGYGADGNDLVSLGGYWKDRLPGAAFIAPNAPEFSEVVPQGRQWFSLGDYDPNRLRRDPAGAAEEYERRAADVEKAAPALNAFIDAELERYGLSDDSLALVGFSQGTMMSLHVSLRRERQCAAVIGYSGALCGAGGTPAATRSHGTSAAESATASRPRHWRSVVGSSPTRFPEFGNRPRSRRSVADPPPRRQQSNNRNLVNAVWWDPPCCVLAVQ
jgi:predicted esterase